MIAITRKTMLSLIYDLNPKCPPRSHVLKHWFPTGGLLGGSGYWEGQLDDCTGQFSSICFAPNLSAFPLLLFHNHWWSNLLHRMCECDPFPLLRPREVGSSHHHTKSLQNCKLKHSFSSFKLSQILCHSNRRLNNSVYYFLNENQYKISKFIYFLK